MKGDLIPPNHHVARLCRASELIYDKGAAVGVTEAVFRPRPSEGVDVSGYWLDFFRGDHKQNILAVLSIIKSQARRTQRLAIVNVGKLAACGVQVIEDPIYEPPPNTNVAHVLLRGMGDREVREAAASLISSVDLVGLSDFTENVEGPSKSLEESQPSCYLSAPANVDTGPLRHVLSELGVRVASPADLPPPGESLPGEIRRMLREADFVCGIVADRPSAATNVVFELGVAAGLSRPIFIIANKEAFFPFGLQAFPYVQGNLADVDAIRFHLAAFLKNMKQSTRAALSPAQPVKQVSAAELHTIADLKHRFHTPNPSESAIVEIVSRALRALGAEVAIESRVEDTLRPDVIAWFPDAATDLGSPLVIDVKRRGGWSSPEVVSQMERYMSSVRARAGLVVNMDTRTGVEVRNVSAGYLFLLSLATFLDLAERGQLLPNLIRARNRFVHTEH